MNTKKIIDGILKRERAVLSQAITLIESDKENHKVQAREIIKNLLPHSGKSLRIAITGSPGVGKSTFIESFGQYLIKEGGKVAVLTIDPSSSFSKGSILGDKTRMENLANENNAFIRPSATKGTLGGVGNATRESIILCEASGYEIILIETVGVGQSETLVRSMVDLFILLTIANTGDELQGMKRGIMEMANLIVVNKADKNINSTKKTIAELKNAIHMFPPSTSGFTTRVLSCSAIKNKGIKDIRTIIEQYVKLTRNNNYFKNNRKRQLQSWLLEILNKTLILDFYSKKSVTKKLNQLKKSVIKKEVDLYNVANELIKTYKSS